MNILHGNCCSVLYVVDIRGCAVLPKKSGPHIADASGKDYRT